MNLKTIKKGILDKGSKAARDYLPNSKGLGPFDCKRNKTSSR